MSPALARPTLAWLLLLPLGASAESQEPARPSLYDNALAWRDESGQPIELSRFRDERVYLTWFYTTCRSHICSRAVESLREIEHALRERGESAQFVLISLDPEHDSPDSLARYKRAYELGANWHLLVGERRQTDWLARRLRYAYYKKDSHYVHSYVIYVLDTRGVIVDVVGWDAKAGDGAPG